KLFKQVIPKDRKLVDFVDFQPTPYLAIGSELPNFEFQTLQGEKKYFSDLRQEGKIAVVYFWKRIVSGDENLRKLNEIKRSLGNDVCVIAIEVASGTSEAILEYLKENKIEINVYKDIKQNLQYRSKFSPFPATIIVDAKNRIQFTRTGTSIAYFLSQGSRRPEYGAELTACLKSLIADDDVAAVVARDAELTKTKLRIRERRLEADFQAAVGKTTDTFHDSQVTVFAENDDRIEHLMGASLNDLINDTSKEDKQSSILPRPVGIWISNAKPLKNFEADYRQLEGSYGNEWIDFRKVTTEQLPLPDGSAFLIVDRSGIVQSAYKLSSPIIDEKIARDLKSTMLGANLLQRWRHSRSREGR
ncbi:MAG: redoxin domain-containing protein, partial [Planctomycetota bacterium]